MRSRIALISPENTVNTRTRSALRATLKQEDAALEDRLPKVTPPATKPPVAKPRPPAVEKTSARPAQAGLSSAAGASGAGSWTAGSTGLVVQARRRSSMSGPGRLVSTQVSQGGASLLHSVFA